jgi:hypothetical protein
MWLLNEREPTFGSVTDEISQTSAGNWKIAPPKEYRCYDNNAS